MGGRRGDISNCRGTDRGKRQTSENLDFSQGSINLFDNSSPKHPSFTPDDDDILSCGHFQYSENNRIETSNILIGEKKVCGILIENEIRMNTLKHSIIGIGINVNLKVKKYPGISSIATSLSDELGSEVSRLELLRQLLNEIENLYSHVFQTDYILDQWQSHLVTLGLRVYVNMGDRYYDGTAESVTKDGSLMLRQKDGSLIKIVAGDVSPK
jgi:hypothetical protein